VLELRRLGQQIPEMFAAFDDEHRFGHQPTVCRTAVS
jgi:hypothetical protein